MDIGKYSQYQSRLLSKVVDKFLGTKEEVFVRREIVITDDYISRTMFHTGSASEGFVIKGSDYDYMSIFDDFIVIDPLSHYNPSRGSLHRTVLYMRNCDCRPGYVCLELVYLPQSYPEFLENALVPVGNSIFVSSDICRETMVTYIEKYFSVVSSGPCVRFREADFGLDEDIAMSFACITWPFDAYEWVTRTRIYGWPPPILVDKIVKDGCHLVPVGDKCSDDTLLQWRISFATAERLLVHSLTHLQFQVYGLMKYLLKQIESDIEGLTGQGDVLCSYFIRTIIFFAVENSPPCFWQERYMFACLMFCFNILIDWVNVGFCPNYFIPTNNMFIRKVNGKNRQKLLSFLVAIRDSKWKCLSIGTFFRPSIGEILQDVTFGKSNILSVTNLEKEWNTDMEILRNLTWRVNDDVKQWLQLLIKPKSDINESICYFNLAGKLASIAVGSLSMRTSTTGNKQQYKIKRKCNRLLAPFAALCPSPGGLLLATFFYHTGNYKKSLVLCGKLMSFKCCCCSKNIYRYIQEYCGKGYTLYQKWKDTCLLPVTFTKASLKFCLPDIHSEILKLPHKYPLQIPPFAYAIFVIFLCYHDLGDSKKRDNALDHLKLVCTFGKRDHGHWVVHNLLGICYQKVGNIHRAIEAYKQSLKEMPEQYNYASERIKALENKISKHYRQY